MDDGLLRALSAPANAWTTGSTWWLFAGAFVVALACLVARGARFARRATTEHAARGDAAVGLGLFLLALALRLLLPERVHYTYNDEYEYLDFAQRLARTGEYRLWTGPPAGIALHAFAFALVGERSDVAFGVTIVAASLSAPALVWTLRRLGVERAVALLAGLLLALAPLHVKHAASASLEVLSLLALLLTVGTWVELLRTPRWEQAACFAVSLLLALTVRAENWALLPLLVLLAWLVRRERAPLPASRLLPALVATLLAALYVPGILDEPIHWEPWWKSRLPAASLLLANLGFWVAGDPMLRKLPLLVAGVGLVAGVARGRTATVFWLAFAALYSVAFVLHGLNVGWVEEAQQPPPWGSRATGHDMFRFDVLLLPAVLYLLASGLVCLARAAGALLRGEAFAASWPVPARGAALVLAGAASLLLVATGGEWRSYQPLQLVASTYNRSFEIAELRFLRRALRDRRGALFVLPPAEGIWIDGMPARPLAELAAPLEDDPTAQRLVYVNGRQLAVPELRQAFLAAMERHVLREVVRHEDGRDRFFLFVAPPRTTPPRAAG